MKDIGLIKGRLKGWNILVVEDEPDSMEVVCRWLKLTGGTIHRAKNGKEGLMRAQEVDPKFIISDLTMPEMDGWEMLYELKQNESTKGIPVIALTAHALKSIQERAIEAGFVAHLSKPINPNKFLFQVMEILENIPEISIQKV